MPKPTTLDKFRDHLWDDIDTLSLSELERRQLLRYRGIFTMMLENPSISNKELAKYLAEQHKIASIGQAYRDIAQAQLLMGNVRSSEKEWVRYLVVEKLKEALSMAEEAGDLKNMIAAADKLGKYMRLDMEDQEPIPYEEIVPQAIEFTNDPTVLGLPPVENPVAKINEAKRRYLDGLEEVEYQDVK